MGAAAKAGMDWPIFSTPLPDGVIDTPIRIVPFLPKNTCVPATSKNLAIALQVANELDRSESVCATQDLKGGPDIDGIQKKIGTEVARRIAQEKKPAKDLNALTGNIDCRKVAGSTVDLGTKVFMGTVACREANLEYSAVVTCALEGTSDSNCVG